MSSRDTKILAIIVSLFLLFISGCIDNEKNVRILGKNIGFDTISEAILSAESGDTILVKPGVYTEHLVITKAVILKGADTDTTIIKGNGSGDVFYITANNVELSGFTIIDSGSGSGSNNNAGIDIRSEFNLLRNITFDHNPNYGLYLYQSHNNTIENCVFTENGESGLCAVYCNDNRYVNNTVVNNSVGFYLRYIYDSMIANNTFTKHDDTMIDKGIYLYAARYNKLIDNVFTENRYGIHVKGSKMNRIQKNLFLNNDLGVYFCCGGMNNTIYQNVFMNNDDHASGYMENTFDNGSIGNYWDDYNGTDTDGDGIGDSPYTVTDEYGIINVDNFPLMKPLQ